MLRLIIRRRMKDQHTGLETDGFETVDMDIPELEQILTVGGMSESGYDVRELAGVEVVPNAKAHRERTE